MKEVADRVHGLGMRPHYEPAELDSLFEREVTTFLRKHRGKVTFPISTDDLTCLLETRADSLDQYADLTPYGPGIHGMTAFFPGRRPQVRISVELAEAASRENRLRTTLTHEYGHVVLHTYLFELDDRQGRLLEPRKPNAIYCKRDSIIVAARSDWMEWQASYACSAVLVPASFARRTAAKTLQARGSCEPVEAASGDGQALIDAIAGEFQVSRDCARVRLGALGFIGQPGKNSALPLR